MTEGLVKQEVLARHGLDDVFGTPIQGTSQTLDVQATANISTRLDAGVRVRLQANVDCWISFCDSAGNVVDTDGTDMMFLAGPPEVFTVGARARFISVIKKEANDGDGDLSITPLAGYWTP